MAESVKQYAKWIGGAVISGTVTATIVIGVNAIMSDDAPTYAQTPAPAAAAPSNSPMLGAQQLDSLTAPIALYPDALLAQVLMATTFPDDVMAAAAWSKQNPKLQGDDAVKAVSATAWDPSVQSLVAFPQVLATMSQKPDWVQGIGQAFLAQPNDVMDSVQRLRAAAQKAGNLQTSQQQKVIVQPASGTSSTQTIVIEQPSPQVVYVPTYNPTTVYGPWPYPTYPPVYMPPPPGYVVGSALVSGMAFGVGIAITNSLWGGCDWGHGDVNVNVNRYNNINVNHRITENRSTSNWDRTNAINTRNRTMANGGANRPNNLGGANNVGANRDAYRGRDGAQRDQARQTLSNRTGQNLNGSASDRVQNIHQGGGAGANNARAGGGLGGGNDRQGGGLGGGNDRQGGNIGGGNARQGGGAGGGGNNLSGRAQDVNRDSAFRDAGNGNAGRQSMDRGQQSRAMASNGARAGGGAPGGMAAGGGAGRAGGGAAGGGGHFGGGGGGGGGRMGGGGGGRMHR